MALTGLAIMAALGLAKSEMVDKPAADKKRKYEAATAAYAPWTGLKSEPVADPNTIGTMIQYGSAGAAMGSNIAKDSAETDLMHSLAQNPTVSGSNLDSSALGGMDMSAKLGDQAKGFSTSMAESPAMNKSLDNPANSAWFFGSSPSKYSQPSFGSPMPGDQYKSIRQAGLSPENPEDSWTINPFAPKTWGGR